MSDNKTVLLIEDDADDERLTLRALRKQNVMNEVVVACDGEEALEYLFREGKFQSDPALKLPALTVLDLKLPKLSGLEVLRRIRCDDRTRHIPVVVLTSSVYGEEMTRAYEAGANSFVTKSADPDEFSETVLHVAMYWLLLNRVPQPA